MSLTPSHMWAAVRLGIFSQEQRSVFSWISDFPLSLMSHWSTADSKCIFLFQLQLPRPATTQGPLKMGHAMEIAGSLATPFPFSVTLGTRFKECLKSLAFSSTADFSGSRTHPPASVRSDLTLCFLVSLLESSSQSKTKMDTLLNTLLHFKSEILI